MIGKIVLGLLLAVITTMASQDQITKANENFATNLNKILSAKDGNVFFSPLSLHSVLALAYQGAAGETAAAFSKTLFLPSATGAASGYKGITAGLNSVVNITLDVANKVYVKDGYKLQSNFEKVARDDFYSEVQQVDFAQSVAAAKTINDWVEQKTHNKIKNLIDPQSLDGLTRLVLVNAIYFKGNWANKFDAKRTKKEPFYLNANDKVDVDMMHINRKFQYGENSQLDAKIIELPYENKDLSLLVVLPNKRDGIKELEQKLSNVDITSLSNELYESDVDLSLPKFKIETTMDLKDTLEQMGLGIMFSDHADFSNLLEKKEPLSVSKVVQKAFIEVNEEGAEAAAATDVIPQTGATPFGPVPQSFNADHPFVFAIYCKDCHVVLFQGQLNTPWICKQN